jgi:hypothetical protein
MSHRSLEWHTCEDLGTTAVTQVYVHSNANLTYREGFSIALPHHPSSGDSTSEVIERVQQQRK